MREPRPDWSPLGVNFKILDEHPFLFYISSPLPRAYRRSRIIGGCNYTSRGYHNSVLDQVDCDNSLIKTHYRFLVRKLFISFSKRLSS